MSEHAVCGLVKCREMNGFYAFGYINFYGNKREKKWKI